METKVCQDCNHFIQHYGINNDRYHWINCGHCIANHRFKHRRALSRVCDQFAQREHQPPMPRDKLLLTVEKIRSILDMELPPEMPTDSD